MGEKIDMWSVRLIERSNGLKVIHNSEAYGNEKELLSVLCILREGERVLIINGARINVPPHDIRTAEAIARSKFKEEVDRVYTNQAVLV